MSIVNLLDEVAGVPVWVLPHDGKAQLPNEAVLHNVGEPVVSTEVAVQIT